ncbi:aminodeoxychorismate/anthranilate synthase component II [Fundidesulfovibrio terrae]|uniref:aminodeoxychorismate/anthranilate synthase component II n=1 Tax=Fundidesulfovibrio terrae TaxID=2922866 RepID=UPI001FAFDF1B|nr:aminodeoxychorismate/anthranilate synthase component II [Fundidesulfovibrio terrae]
MRILLADNRDSFTRNLEHLLHRVCGVAPEIVSYPDLDSEAAARFDLTVVSPGPGHPRDYPAYGPLLASGRPVLGVCLGLQIATLHFGGEVSRLPGCFHGRPSRFEIFGRQVDAARYHSLYVSRPGPDMEVLARCGEIPMAARHRTLPVLGLQFHPESFLTPQGAEIIRECLQMLLPG